MHPRVQRCKDSQTVSSRWKGISFQTKLIPLVLVLCVFIGMLVFFTSIYPLYIFDTDDWTYAARTRLPIPLWGVWNPTRVLPETLMPLCGGIAAYCVYPINGDYIESLMLVFAFVVALSIASYSLCSYLMLRRRFNLSSGASAGLSLLFVLAHFVPFVVAQSNNLHLFFSHGTCTYFYYVIPNLLAASLVMLHLAGCWDERGADTLLGTGVLIVAVYFTLFSNLFASVILVAYVGALLVKKLVKTIRARDGIIQFARNNAAYLLIVAVWVLVQVFETSGGRAGSADQSMTFAASLVSCAKSLAGWRSFVNPVVVLVGAVIVLVGVIHVVRFRSEDNERKTIKCVAILIFSFLLVAAYLLLVCAKSMPSYISRPDVAFGMFFYAYMVIMLLSACLISRHPYAVTVLPVLIVICCFAANTTGRTYRIPNLSGADSCDIVKEIDQDIIRQVKEAEQAGTERVEVRVPKFDSSDNFPLASSYGGARIEATLFKHGIIDRHMQIVLVPSPEKSQEFGVGSA